MRASHYLPAARYTSRKTHKIPHDSAIRVAEWPTRARSRSAQFVCMTLGVIPELEAMIESTGGVSVSKQLHLEVATFRSVLRMRASKRTRRVRRHGPRRRANLSAFAAAMERQRFTDAV